MIDSVANDEALNQGKQNARLRLFVLIFLAVLLLALAAAWSWSPMKQLLSFNQIVAALRALGTSYGPVAAIIGFGAALVLAVPLAFLTLVALVAYGSITGILIALAAAALGAIATFSLGKILGHAAIQKMGGAKINLISQALAQRGLMAVIAVRLVPIAPFAIVNMVAGASHLRLRDMVIGTLLGMLPGTLGMAFFLDYIMDALQRPSLGALLLGLLALGLIVAGFFTLRKWLTSLAQVAPEQCDKR